MRCWYTRSMRTVVLAAILVGTSSMASAAPPARAPIAQPAPHHAGVGSLTVITLPWSQCTLGNRTFTTPQIALEVTAGTYMLRCVRADSHLSGTVHVAIVAGRETRVRIALHPAS